MNNIQELLGTLSIEIADLVAERNAGRIARGEIMADNVSLRDQLAKTDATLMALCQALNLDPTGDPVAEVKARKTAQPDIKVAAPLPPKPIDVAQAVWPGAWSEDGDMLTLVLAEPGSLIIASIAAHFDSARGWYVQLNNRGVWSLLAKSADLAEALTLARDEMRQTVADLAKGVG